MDAFRSAPGCRASAPSRWRWEYRAPPSRACTKSWSRAVTRGPAGIGHVHRRARGAAARARPHAQSTRRGAAVRWMPSTSTARQRGDAGCGGRVCGVYRGPADVPGDRGLPAFRPACVAGEGGRAVQRARAAHRAGADRHHLGRAVGHRHRRAGAVERGRSGGGGIAGVSECAVGAAYGRGQAGRRATRGSAWRERVDRRRSRRRSGRRRRGWRT